VVVKAANHVQNIRSAVLHHQRVVRRAATAKNQRQGKKDEDK